MEAEALKKILAQPSALTVKLNGIAPKDISPYLREIEGKQGEYDFNDILRCLGFFLYEDEEDLLSEDDEPGWINNFRGLRLILEYLRFRGVLDKNFRFSEKYKQKNKKTRAHIVRAVKEKFNWREAWQAWGSWNGEEDYRENSAGALNDPETERICSFIETYDISPKKVR